MSKPLLTLSDFVAMGSRNPTFLRTYISDPMRLQERYELEAGLLEKILSNQVVLDGIAASDAQDLAAVTRSLASVSPADFTDSFGDRGFRDSFRDGGGHTDRHRDNPAA